MSTEISVPPSGTVLPECDLRKLQRRLGHPDPTIPFEPAWDEDEPLALDTELRLAALTSLDRVAGLRLRELTVEGRFGDGPDRWNRMARAWGRLSGVPADETSCQIEATLRFAGAEEPFPGNEQLAWTVRHGAPEWRFQVVARPAVARERIEEALRQLDLPVLVEAIEDDYRLRRTDGGRLAVSYARPGGRSPLSFSCAAAPADGPAMVAAVRAAVAALAGGATVDLEWSIWTDEPRVAVRLARSLGDPALEADEFRVEWNARWRKLERIVELRRLLDPGAGARTVIGTLGAGEVVIWSTSEGERLIWEGVTAPDSASLLRRLAGLD